MRQMLAIIISALFLAPGFMTNGTSNNTDMTEINQDDPAYAKWGRLAMEETNSRYPDARIIDYLHRGRDNKGKHTVEKFKLWLEEDEKEFGVFINITFNTQSEEVHDISFTETTE